MLHAVDPGCLQKNNTSLYAWCTGSFSSVRMLYELFHPSDWPSYQQGIFLQTRATGRLKLLDSDGICAVGESIQSDDVYINKSTPLVTRPSPDAPAHPNAVLPDSAYKPTPQKYKGPVGETCVVDRVLLTTNDDSTPTIKVSASSMSIHVPLSNF